MATLVSRVGAALGLALSVLVAAGSAGEPARPPTLAELAWISGSWMGEHDGGLIEEHWTGASGRSMIGMGRLTIKGKTVFVEFLRIVQNEDGTIDYWGLPGGKGTPVAFRLTSLSERRAVFENPQHDDPKLIMYRLEPDGSLFTRAEGPDKDGKTVNHDVLMARSTLAPKS